MKIWCIIQVIIYLFVQPWLEIILEGYGKQICMYNYIKITREFYHSIKVLRSFRSPLPPPPLKTREAGETGSKFVVPFIRWLKFFGSFYYLIGWFHTQFKIPRNGYFVYYDWCCTLIYHPLSYPLKSLNNKDWPRQRSEKMILNGYFQ